MLCWPSGGLTAGATRNRAHTRHTVDNARRTGIMRCCARMVFKKRGGGGAEKVSSRPCQYIRARLLQSLLQVGSLNWAIISYILTLPLVVQCIRAWLRRRKGVWVSDLEDWSLIKFPKASLMRRLFIFISPNSKLRPAHEIVSRDAIRRRLSLDLPASTQEIQEPEISCRSAAH